MMVGSVFESVDMSLEDNPSKMSDSRSWALSGSFPCVQAVGKHVLSGAWVQMGTLFLAVLDIVRGIVEKKESPKCNR